MTPRLVMVTWNDAHATGAEDFDAKKHHAPCVMHTVGWLVQRDDTGLSIGCERYEENGVWCYRGVTFVPAGMMVKVSRV